MALRDRVASSSSFPPQVGAAANSVARRTRSRYRDAPANATSLSASASTSPVSFVCLDDADNAESDLTATEGQSSLPHGQRRRGRPSGCGAPAAIVKGDPAVSRTSLVGHVSSPTAPPRAGCGGCIAKRTRSRFLDALATLRSHSSSSATVFIDLCDSDEADGGFESLGAQEEGNDEPSRSVDGSAGGAVDVSFDSAAVDDRQQLEERGWRCHDNAIQATGHVGLRQGENASLPQTHGELRYDISGDEPEAGRSLDISCSRQQMQAELLRSNTNSWHMCHEAAGLAAASVSGGVEKKGEGISPVAVADSNSVEEKNLEAEATLGTSSACQQMEFEMRGSNTNTGDMSEGASFAVASLSGGSKKKEESSVAAAAAAASSSTKRKEENITVDKEMCGDSGSPLLPLVSDNEGPYEAAASAFAASSSADNIGKPVPQVTNCVASRTRARLWGGKLRPVDYTKFFKKTVELEEEEEDPCLLVSSSSLSSSMSGTLDTEDSSSSDDLRQRTEVNSWSEAEEVFDLGEESGEEYFEFGSRHGGWCQGLVFRERKGHGAKQDRKSSCFPAVEERIIEIGDATATSLHHYNMAYMRGSAGKQAAHLKRKRSTPGIKRKRQRLVQKNSLNDGGTHAYVRTDESSDSGSVSSSFSDSDDVGGMHSKVSKKKSKLREEEDDAQLPRKARKRKRSQPLVDEELLKTLLDTISKEGDPLEEGGFISKEPNIPTFNSGMPGDTLPLIFSFDDDAGSEMPEKTENDKEMDTLWDEYNFCLRSTDICSYDIEKDDERQFEKVHSSVPCTQEKHSFILDDEFGIACKFCSAVLLEMRHILPNFAINSSIYSKMLSCGGVDIPKLDQPCAQEMSIGPSDLPYLSTGTVWDLIPGVKETMYPHQQEGFEFMWRNLAGDISLDKLSNSFNSDAIGGCVISHAPGTGKTRLSIMFLQSFMAAYPNCRPVILAPRGMLTMWEKEFVKWKVNIPFHILNKDDSAGTGLPLVSSKSKSVLPMRIMKLHEWITGKGVLGLSYGLFERLVSTGLKECPGNGQFSKPLIEKPGLFIFDEGHTPRNETSNIWKVLEKVKAERRIILSGTPFQNNFGELYNTLCLVRPKFAENITVKAPNVRSKSSESFPNLEVTNSKRNVGRGKWTCLTSSIDDETIQKLKSMISPFVHVHNGSILKSLPGLRECLIVLELHPQQKHIIDLIEHCNSETTFTYWYKVSLAAIHPALYAACKLSEEEKAGTSEKNLIGKRLNPNEGAKTKFVVELVRLSSSLKEKVLIFSQYLEPLSLMKDQLVSLFNWTEGRELLQMDGKICMRQRQLLIDKFNEPTSEVRVLLASTKACCEGISLTGASRVVLLDVVWNPSVENQAISRAFRIGQERIVYTYHLIAHDTRETVKYERQIQKEHISKRVFSSSDCHKGMEENISDLYEDKILEEIKCHEKLKGMFKRVVYRPKNSNLL